MQRNDSLVPEWFIFGTHLRSSRRDTTQASLFMILEINAVRS